MGQLVLFYVLELFLSQLLSRWQLGNADIFETKTLSGHEHGIEAITGICR
jgi:hypothetical protein